MAKETNELALQPELIVALERCMKFQRRVHRVYDPEWENPSPMTEAFGYSEGPYADQIVLALSRVLWGAMGAHLIATNKLLLGLSSAGAGATMRASLESMLLLDWLLGQQSQAVRRGRAAALLYRDFTRGVAGAELDADFDTSRLVEGLQEDGVEVELNRKGEPCWFNGQTVPKTENLLKETTLGPPNQELISLSAAYSRLSGLVHGQSWRFLLRTPTGDLPGAHEDYDLYGCHRSVWGAYVTCVDRTTTWLTGIPCTDQPWARALLTTP